MALPASGAISFNNINAELGVAGTTQASLGQTSYRTLAGVPSGQISMNNFYGKANAFTFTISSPQTNANLATLGTAAGWPGTAKLVATIAPGIVITSNATGTSALTISGSFPGGVELINNGTIVGRGGNGGAGGNGSSSSPGSPGAVGGPALTVSSAVSINNLGTIAGGGGGGGGGAARPSSPSAGNTGGGGGGGGRSSLTNSSGGAGGNSPSGASVVPGGPGTFSAAGAGGFMGYPPGSGGPGGGWGSSGSSGNPTPGRSGGSGGGGGSAVSGNPNVTWINTGTRLGGIT